MSRTSKSIAALIALAAISITPAGAAVFGDFDGQAPLSSDILWRNATTGENYIYPMSGLAIKGTEGNLRSVADQNWRVVGVGDFDGNGKADILWRNFSTGENYIYSMDNTTLVREGYIRTVSDLNWQVVAVGDFDGDGKADILWRNGATGENYIYPMDLVSNVITIKATEGYIRTVSDLNWRVVGAGDFNGDGKADVLWRNLSTGENYIYPMNGTTILAGEGYIRTVSDLNWQVVGVGDFTAGSPSRADILWRNAHTGENYIYPMNGTTIVTGEGYIRTVSDQNWQVVEVGDFDGDAKADILWRNKSTGENYVYPMDFVSNVFVIKVSEGFIRSVSDQAWQVEPEPIQASMVASRLSGVAPLYIFFDATATVSKRTSRPFHELEFRWDFGDPGSGNWSTTGLSKNSTTGGVAAHLYETPGTYTVTLAVTDGTSTARSNVQITVQDPNTVFAGTNTVCVSTTTDFNGCPAGALQVPSITNLANIISLYAMGGKRLLFHRGQTWTSNLPITILDNSSTPRTIGSYGPSAGTAKLVSTQQSFDNFIALGHPTTPNLGDVRIMDLEIDGGGNANADGFGLGGRANRVTLLRINLHSFPGNGVVVSEFVSSGQGQIYSQIAIIDSTLRDCGGYPAYFAAQKSALLGNNLFNTVPNNAVGVFRTQYFTKSVMSNNRMAGSPQGFHLVKFGAGKNDLENGIPPPSLYVGVKSELSVISDNDFDDRTGNGGWMIPMGPENNHQDEEVRDIVIERNWVRAGTSTEIAFKLFASKMTLRNNLIDISGETCIFDICAGIHVNRRGVEPVPSMVQIYDNTFFRSTGLTANSYSTVRFELGSNMVVRNNLGYTPALSSSQSVFLTDNAIGTVASNNSTNAQQRINPNFTTTPPTLPQHYKPTAGSYAIGAGSPSPRTPVWSDFFRVDAPGTADIGAVIH